MEDSKYCVNINIPFPDQRLAEIAYEVLHVDAEPKRSGVEKKIIQNNNLLQVKFQASLARQLRVAVNGFFENIILIIQTINTFGSPVSNYYSFKH